MAIQLIVLLMIQEIVLAIEKEDGGKLEINNMKEKAKLIAEWVWRMHDLTPDETIKSYTMEEFQEKVQAILDLEKD